MIAGEEGKVMRGRRKVKEKKELGGKGEKNKKKQCRR